MALVRFIFCYALFVLVGGSPLIAPPCVSGVVEAHPLSSIIRFLRSKLKRDVPPRGDEESSEEGSATDVADEAGEGAAGTNGENDGNSAPDEDSETEAKSPAPVTPSSILLWEEESDSMSVPHTPLPAIRGLGLMMMAVSVALAFDLKSMPMLLGGLGVMRYTDSVIERMRARADAVEAAKRFEQRREMMRARRRRRWIQAFYSRQALDYAQQQDEREMEDSGGPKDAPAADGSDTVNAGQDMGAGADANPRLAPGGSGEAPEPAGDLKNSRVSMTSQRATRR